jgi:hypothetical protein
MRIVAGDSTIPDVSLVEIAGFSFDMTSEEDRVLLDLVLETLGEADREEVTKRVKRLSLVRGGEK